MRVNNQITQEKLIVIDETGKNLGVLSRNEALSLAQQKGLDLVEVNPAAKPPVCKIVDYGKFEYRRHKAERKIKAGRQAQELKNIRIGLKTSSHDLGTKARQAEKFLEKGNKVRLEIFLRGREKAHRDLAKEKLQSFEASIKMAHKADDQMKSSPSGWAMIISR